MTAALKMATEQGPHWYRVQVDSTGKVIGCVRLATAPGADGSGIYYVQANDEAAAKASAFEQYKEKQRQALAARRLRLREEGLCRCGSKLDTDGKTCSRCQRKNLDDKQRSAARSSGAKVTAPSKVAAFRETRELRTESAREEGRREARDTARLMVLLEVKAAWVEAQNVGRFTEWLKAQIAAAGGTAA